MGNLPNAAESKTDTHSNECKGPRKKLKLLPQPSNLGRMKKIETKTMIRKSTSDLPKKKENNWNASDRFGLQVISLTQKDRC